MTATVQASAPSIEQIPSLTETRIYSFKPTHEQIWNRSSEETEGTQYADWNGRHVTLYQPTDCDDGANATQIESLNRSGTIVITKPFTRSYCSPAIYRSIHTWHTV